MIKVQNDAEMNVFENQLENDLEALLQGYSVTDICVAFCDYTDLGNYEITLNVDIWFDEGISLHGVEVVKEVVTPIIAKAIDESDYFVSELLQVETNPDTNDYVIGLEIPVLLVSEELT